MFELTNKTCSKCHKILEIAEFRIKSDKKNKPRYSAQCNECTREYQRKKRSESSSYLSATYRWKKDHHQEFLAHKLVLKAVKSGKIKRPECCSLCGKVCTPQAHHVDYLKPLEVMWLCPSCHKKQHC